ncbi:MAG: hypothetical protein ACFB51_04750 [Anaerolineae bacterium]
MWVERPPEREPEGDWQEANAESLPPVEAPHADAHRAPVPLVGSLVRGGLGFAAAFVCGLSGVLVLLGTNSNLAALGVVFLLLAGLGAVAGVFGLVRAAAVFLADRASRNQEVTRL